MHLSNIDMHTCVSDSLLHFPTYEFDQTGGKDWTYVKGALDKAISKGSVISVFTHGVIANDTPTQYSISLTQFTQFVDYAISKGVEFLTISEYYDRVYGSKFNQLDKSVCTTSTRPTAAAKIGDTTFDSTIGCTISYKGSGIWVNGIGTTV